MPYSTFYQFADHVDMLKVYRLSREVKSYCIFASELYIILINNTKMTQVFRQIRSTLTNTIFAVVYRHNFAGIYRSVAEVVK